MGPRRLNAVAGHAVMNLVKAHLRERDQQGNWLGGKRTHFFSKAAQGTHEEHDEDKATVTVSATGIAMQVFGGTVVPVNRRFLTIPLVPEAYGKRVSDFPDTFVWKKANGLHAFIARRVMQGKGDKATGHLQILFALVRAATIRGDRTVLPSDEAIATTARTTVDAFIARQIELGWNGTEKPL